ncbi:HNH endonuclease [Comamonas thiooxydans]|nr:HNH endonuclease signature motif containing protein [Comamonas thiooxydans]
MPKSKRLTMLKPRLQVAVNPNALKVARKPRASRTGRDADPRRALPLTSTAWRKLRASVLAEQPLCVDCAVIGRTSIAEDVDHKDGNPGNNERENLQGLCHPCHSRKTAADHGKTVRMGSDVHGMPLDPRHPWNQEITSNQADLTAPLHAL